MKKKILFLVALVALALVLTGCPDVLPSANPIDGKWEGEMGTAPFNYTITFDFTEGTVKWTQVQVSDKEQTGTWEGTFVYDAVTAKVTVKQTGSTFVPNEYELTAYLDKKPQEIWEPKWEKDDNDEWVHKEKDGQKQYYIYKKAK